MNITTLHLRYTQFFIICLAGIAFCTMIFSLLGKIENFEGNLWNRNTLIVNFTKFKMALGDRIFSEVLVGKEGWLEYTGDNNLEEYQNTIGISPETLKDMQQKIQNLYTELKKRNITLLIVIAPNKATIYPDKLPDEIQKLKSKSNLDLFAAYLSKHGPPVLVDLRPGLQNARKNRDVYYATDTHWNAYGAFIGYTEIMNKLSETYPQLTKRNINEFSIEIKQPYAHDIPILLGLTDLQEPGIQFTHKKNTNLQAITFNDDNIVPMQVITAPDNKDAPSLLIYMDSFGMELKKFLTPHFSKTTLIKAGTRFPDLLSMKKINETHPDIVILEFIERSFSSTKSTKKLYYVLQMLLSEKTK